MTDNGANEAPASTSAPAAAPIIALDKVALTLTSDAGPVNILRGIDLDVAAGELVSIVGPSGSGKTSLMMVIAGLERPTGGQVSVAGTSFGGMSEDALARFRRDRVGIVFQNFHLVPTMTALENVAIPLEFAGQKDPFGVAEAGLDAVGLGSRIRHFPGQLSGGEQQRVAIARAFAAAPDLLLADEPTGNLDQQTGEQVIDVLLDLRAKTGATLVLITHDRRISERCSREIRLKDGQIAGDGRDEDGLGK